VDLRVTAFVAAMLAAVLFLKWGVRRAARPLPREVYAVLGEAPLGGQHSARIVRFGPKTILIAVSGAACTPLSEIDDALVTEQLATACGMGASPPCAVPPTGAQRPVRGDPPATAMEAST
jgi:flagellar biogenesis protein FliO